MTTTQWTARDKYNGHTYTITGNTLDEALLQHAQRFTPEWSHSHHHIERTSKRRATIYFTNRITNEISVLFKLEQITPTN